MKIKKNYLPPPYFYFLYFEIHVYVVNINFIEFIWYIVFFGLNNYRIRRVYALTYDDIFRNKK